MVRWTPEIVEQLRAWATPLVGWPRVAIETGTWNGKNAAFMSPYYDAWHTVDISAVISAMARKRCKEAGVTNVIFYVGDSRKVLPKLLDAIKEPVAVYLDAHYMQAPLVEHRASGADFPLWEEFEAIAARPIALAPLVLIDDWILSRKDCSRLRAPGDDSPQWEALSKGVVKERLGGVIKTLGVGGALAVARKE
jgi:hypothetical protein